MTSSPLRREVDVAVIGGGPAGAAAATRLSRWGYSVALLTKPTSPEVTLGESLPPSIMKPLIAVGLERAVEGKGFYRSQGNTVWWGEGNGRSEPFASGGQGYQVARHVFDQALLAEATAAGAAVLAGAVVRDVELERSPAQVSYQTVEGQHHVLDATMVLDCSGRSGVIARRGHRRLDSQQASIALVGMWSRAGAWSVPDPSHTLVESYADGWGWSVPVSPSVRYVAFMIDPRTTSLSKTGDTTSVYQGELNKTVQLLRMVRGAWLMRKPWGRDASVYSASKFGGSGFLLVGDAASSLDPLSSFGVRKALMSAWLAAVVTRTKFRRSEMETAALDLFARHETQVFEASHKLSAGYSSDAGTEKIHPFWVNRSDLTEVPLQVGDHEFVEVNDDSLIHDAFESLRNASRIDLRVTAAVRLTKTPAVRNDEVTLEEAVVVAGWSVTEKGLCFLRGVNVPLLVDIAGAYSQVPDLFEAYNRSAYPVTLEQFLRVLSVLIAKGALRNLAE